MITMEPRTIIHCTCDHCGWEWDSFKRDKKTGRLISVKPKRCAGCKYLTWDTADRRFNANRPPPESANGNGKAPSVPPSVPELHPKELLQAFTASRGILQRLVEDNPCDHPKECVCAEKKLLAKIDRQIDILNKLTAKKEPAKVSV